MSTPRRSKRCSADLVHFRFRFTASALKGVLDAAKPPSQILLRSHQLSPSFKAYIPSPPAHSFLHSDHRRVLKITIGCHAPSSPRTPNRRTAGHILCQCRHSSLQSTHPQVSTKSTPSSEVFARSASLCKYRKWVDSSSEHFQFTVC